MEGTACSNHQGEFRSGVVYTMRGGIGIGKIVVHTLLLPVYACGVEINLSSSP